MVRPNHKEHVGVFCEFCYGVLVDNDLADSWDVDDDIATTPEDDVPDDLDDAEGGSVPKVSKKKLPKVEEARSKKEHVNVVFIGHVGK